MPPHQVFQQTLTTFQAPPTVIHHHSHEIVNEPHAYSPPAPPSHFYEPPRYAVHHHAPPQQFFHNPPPPTQYLSGPPPPEFFFSPPSKPVAQVVTTATELHDAPEAPKQVFKAVTAAPIPGFFNT